MKGTLKLRTASLAAAAVMAAGLFAALIFEIVPTLYNIFGGGVLPAVLITVAGTLIPHFLLKRKNI